MKLNAAFFCLMVAAPVTCLAQNFSADIVFTGGTVDAGSPKADFSSHAGSRLLVNGDKMRLELDGAGGTVLLVNGAEQTAFAIFPAKKEYEVLAGSPSEYFRVSDPENACPAWQKASAQNVVCEKVGHEVVDGRPTVRYRNKAASDVALSAVWIDVGVKYVVKWEAAGAGAELRHIREGEQSADLFTLPSDYDVSKPRKGMNKGFSHR